MVKRYPLIVIKFILILNIILSSCTQEDIDKSQFGFVQSWVNDTTFIFMHITDTHGSDKSSHMMKEMLNSIAGLDFGIISGDILPTDFMIYDINSCKRPIFVVPGNHDAYNHGGQYFFRKNIGNAMPIKTGIKWGNDTANYFYNDYKKNNQTLRIICLDQYETDVVGASPNGGIVMSQNQINWLCTLLEHSDTVDAVMLQMHCGYGNKKYGSRDSTRFNEFTSIRANEYDNTYDYHSDGHPLMIPEIINAYQTGINIKNRRYCTGIQDDSLTVNTNFKKASNNIIGHFGGHLHWDLVENLPSYNDNPQLQVLMTFCGWGDGQCYYNDIIKTEVGKDSYNINLNIVDTKKRKLKIVRIGANKKVDGTTRDSITFYY